MIHRFEENPLIKPDSNITWMTENAFNPGVVKRDGTFHMLIRGGRFRTHQRYADLGYATSEDGIHWNVEAHPSISHWEFGGATENGIEDPRIVRWRDRYYIFATACYARYGRIGIWSTKDFYHYIFHGIPFDWEDKDASIFPELINGQMYMIHRMHPNMWISRTSEENFPHGWESTELLLKANDVLLDGNTPIKIGLNGPPMRFGNDWFVMFHARFEPVEYRSSFMILDGDNPHRIKYTHQESILRPELDCEKWGAVPYVCFNNAIVDMDDRWYLYWGGADTVICGGYLLKKDVKPFMV